MSSDDIAKSLTKKSCKTCSQEFTGSTVVCPHDGTLLTPVVVDPLIGSVLGDRYKILSMLGKGGMGSVYKATHLLMDRAVAIKVLHAHLIEDPHALARFQQEAKACCSLMHPNIIQVHDFGIAPQGQPFLVMEYVKGISMAEAISRVQHLDPTRALHIFIQACEAFGHAHEHGVIHRDIKPSNIILTTSGEDSNFVKILDFGIAKLLPSAGFETMSLTQTGEIFGSPLYMSPEQCMAQKLDPRADIYSLGCVLYQALTGVPPLVGKHSVDTIQRHVNEMPRPLKYANPQISVPDGMEPVIFKALAKDPNQRYQSMKDLKKDLERIARGTGPGMVAPVVAEGSAEKDQAASASDPEQAQSGGQETTEGKSLRGQEQTADHSRARQSNFSRLMIGSAVALAIGIAATAWLFANGVLLVPIVDPRLMCKWYCSAAETAVKADNLADAEKWAGMAIKAADQLPEPKLRMSHCFNLLGDVYMAGKRYSDAEMAYEKGLAIRTNANSLDNPEAVDLMTNLAQVFELDGKYPFAEMQYQRLLEHEKIMFGADHPEVAKLHMALAKVFELDGKLTEAYKQYLRAIAITENNSGPKSKLLAPILRNCAKLADELDRKAEAGSLTERAVKIDNTP